MKTRLIPCLTLLAGLGALAQAGPLRPGPLAPGRGDVGRGDVGGAASAMREEAMLDKRDTHGPMGVWDKDRRPKDVPTYHSVTFARIRGLLVDGTLSEAQGTTFKKEHEAIGVTLKAALEGGLDATEAGDIRSRLDKLNEAINEAVAKGKAGNPETPLLNYKKHRMEEAIEFGERSGRLTGGQASRMRRDLEQIGSLEERLKGKELSTREREKLHEQANELILKLRRELID